MQKVAIDARMSGMSTGRYVDKLVEYLHKLKPEGYQFVILTKPHCVDFLKQIAPGFQVIEAPFKEFTFDEQLPFKKLIQSLKPDLVHFTKVEQPVLYRGKTVTTMHDLTTVRFRNPSKNPVVFKIKQIIYKWVNKKAARKASVVITPTEFVKNDVVKYTGIKADKVVVTYEAADKITDEASPVSGLEGKPYIMYTGRPTPHKNLRGLIEAFVKLQATHPELRLVLSGNKDANYISHEQWTKDKGIKNVVFTGFTSEGQLRWLYENAKVYAFPSLSEGFGLPGLEAMMHECPVAASNATCLPEVYKDGAAYFDPLNIDEMAQVLGKVIDDPVYAKQLVEKGRQVAAGYSWQRMAKQTLEVYKKAIG